MNNLEVEARWLLEHADQSPPVQLLRGMALQLRLWRYPRSGPHVSWSIIQPVREFRDRNAVVREIAWDREADLKKFRRRPLPRPSLHLRDAEIEWADLAPFIDTTGGLPMASLGKDPAMPSKDDVSGLEGYRSLAHVRLEWAGKGPRAWGPTIAWIARFRTLILRALGQVDQQDLGSLPRGQ